MYIRKTYIVPAIGSYPPQDVKYGNVKVLVDEQVFLAALSQPINGFHGLLLNCAHHGGFSKSKF